MFEMRLRQGGEKRFRRRFAALQMQKMRLSIYENEAARPQRSGKADGGHAVRVRNVDEHDRQVDRRQRADRVPLDENGLHGISG